MSGQKERGRSGTQRRAARHAACAGERACGRRRQQELRGRCESREQARAPAAAGAALPVVRVPVAPSRPHSLQPRMQGRRESGAAGAASGGDRAPPRVPLLHHAPRLFRSAAKGRGFADGPVDALLRRARRSGSVAAGRSAQVRPVQRRPARQFAGQLRPCRHSIDAFAVAVQLVRCVLFCVHLPPSR